MKLTIIGSGTAVIRKQRKSTSLLLKINKKLLLFDCGWGCGINLLKAGFDIQKIDHIFITHPHADHLSNLMNLLQSILVSGQYFPETKRKKPLYIHGYKGFKKDYEKLRQIMFPERKENYKIEVLEYFNKKRKIDGFLIQAKEVKHKPVLFHATAFRIEYQNKIFVYSGDCGYDKRLTQLAKNANLAVFEAAVPLEDYREYGPFTNHLSAFEASSIAEKAQVKKLALVHLYDKTPAQEIKKAVRKNFKGTLIIAKDLQVINF